MNFKFLNNLFIYLFFLPIHLWAVAGPAYDDCDKAFRIKNVANYCSSPRQFTNDGASASDYNNPACFPPYITEPDNDVWFKFKAIANTVNISVIGATKGIPKGTLRNPQIALYTGDCVGGLLEIACIGDAQGYNIVETFINDLAIGGTYYLRVDGRNGHTGSFQLCINNYNPVPSPSSDCSSAVVLCDKSSFTVPSISGAGLNRFELPRGICLEEESSSAWYKWTCQNPGELTFILKPVNPADDLDFALFLLPNGVDDCSVKIPIRCMASGENVTNDVNSWKRCTGATGLKSRAADLQEAPGCEDWDDNFVAALQMESGDSYALLVNNYHNTGNGFSIEFAGNGTFKGPKAHFVVNKLKLEMDKELWVRNKSSFEGGIKNWEWNFGVDADPPTAKGVGPHKVMYKSSGKKSISLAVETGNGCQVTKVRNVTILDPPPPPSEPEVEEAPVIEPVETQTKEGTSAIPSDEATPAPSEITDTPAPPTEEAPPSDETSYSEPEETYVKYDVKYTATIYFSSDSSALETDDIEMLEKVMGLMRENPEYKAIVEGHTNNIPDSKYCNKLASERAGIVIQWLNGKGIKGERIIRKIFGKDKVFEKEDTKYRNRKRYQKAVIRIVKRE